MKLLHQAILYLAQTLKNIGNLIDVETIFIHSPLLNHPERQTILLHSLNHSSTRLLSNHFTLNIQPYNEFTGAIAACALCVQKLFIENNDFQ
ncbi:hypothetical protein IAG15_14670 [Enterococcus faecalis]|nr:hypothetical protein [Enterococcus faecalis]